MSNYNTIIANIKHAIREKQTANIGGGTFNATELNDFLNTIKVMEDTIHAGKLLCANLERGGVGQQSLIENFYNNVDKL
jgi:hypothetical protein